MSNGKKLGSYGITDFMKDDDFLDEAVAELKINGYTSISSGLSDALLAELKDVLDKVYKTQVSELGSERMLEEVKDIDITRCVMSYDIRYLSVATTPVLLELAKRYLGDNFVLLQQNGITNRAERKNYQINWHRDLSYQHWICSKPIAMNALLCLDDFTFDNGSTFVLPGSHNISEFPPEKVVNKYEIQLTAKAGTFLVLDAMTFHRGGFNHSKGSRRAVNHVIGLPFMAQQISIPKALDKAGFQKPADSFLLDYLGFRWAPADNALDWRMKRIEDF